MITTRLVGLLTAMQMPDWLESILQWDWIPRIRLGKWIEDIIDWLKDNVSWLFDIIKDVLTWLYDVLVDVLTYPAPFIFALILAVLAWRIRGPLMALFTLVGLALIANMNYWMHSMQTLSLVLISAIIAVIIGIPTGILAARSKVVSAVVRPILDFMQTMPAFVYLIPAVSFFRIGVVPGMVATVVFSMPPAVRLTELGIRQVDEEVVEAGHAFGASPRRILFSIQLPLARPTIMAGVNQVIMLALSMVVIAGMIGADGLGSDVYSAVLRLRIGDGFEAGLAVVILAVILDRFTSAFGADAQDGNGSGGGLKKLFARLFGTGRKGGDATAASEQATPVGQ